MEYSDIPAKQRIAINTSHHRVKHGQNPYFTLTGDGARQLDAFLKSKGINIGKAPAVHADIIREFCHEGGMPSSLSVTSLASLLGGICESYVDDYLNLDAVALGYHTTLNKRSDELQR